MHGARRSLLACRKGEEKMTRGCVVAAVLSLSCGIAIAAPADDLKRLVEQGRSAEAYALGKANPEEFGKADFDFYYGIAAVDSGNAGDGVLALERYVVRFPDNDRARLELARGYFVLGEMLRAREEFEAVSRRKPPPDVQATIDRFLDSIRSQESRYTVTTNLWAEAGVGYDTNVNSGAGSGLISVPALGNLQLQLAPNGIKSGDNFMTVAGGAQASYPIAPGVALQGGVQADGKLHQHRFEQQFDQTNASAYGGVSVIKDKNLYRGTLSFSTLSVDYARFRDVVSAGGEWHHQLDELNTVSAFGQYARFDYPSSPVRDADFYAIGAGWRRALVHRLQPVFQVQALLAQEKNDNSRNDLSRDLVTARAGVSLTPAPKWGASVGASYTQSQFKAPDPLFLNVRKDHFYGLEGAVSYQWSKQLTLKLEYTRSENQSNLALYDYKRDMIAAKVRYEFR